MYYQKASLRAQYRGKIKMLPRSRRIHNKSFLRFLTALPDNSPRVSENERWLDTLGQPSKKKRNIERTETRIDHAKDEQIKERQGALRYYVESSPPESAYIKVKSSLANFTSVSYLQNNKARKAQQSSFVDFRIIKCSSGNGGNGMVSFFRDAGRAIGPPDGGDGGDGGSVYIQAVEGMNTLSKLKNTYIAQDGHSGAAAQFDGAKGKDVLITVPVGTVVKWCIDPNIVRNFVNDAMKSHPDRSLRDILNSHTVSLNCTGRHALDCKPSRIQLFRKGYEPGEGWLFKEKDAEYHLGKDWFQALKKKVEAYDDSLLEEELIKDAFPFYGLDLDKPTNTPICLLAGGKGGLGNMHFLTNTIRNPRFAKAGRSGIEQYFMFELKSLADLGLIGFPNAGKSTILNKISNAKPRIGHWPFTTLHPTVGTISMGIHQESFTVADIPGIIEGASKDKGMGLEFLRHIERSKGWVFVLSLDKPSPIYDLLSLIKELKDEKEVSLKNVLVVCNKADIDYKNPESRNKFLRVREYCQERNWDIIPISALKSENMDLLVRKMARCAGKAPM